MAFARKTLFLIAAGLVLAGVTRAADAPKPTKPDVALKSNAPELQKLIDQFSAQRDTLLADRAALLDQLKNATAEQRKAILEKAETQQKELIEAQRALGKRIRDEMPKIRETRPGSSR
jgi:uncharacterized protein YlxW (UPF0749 family)